MRIRKRSMLPLSLSSPPRVASDLFSPRGGASVQKEEDERVVRGPAGERELVGEGGFDRGSAFSTLPGRRRSDNGPPFRRGGFCDHAEEEEANRCCMLSPAPILSPVKAYRDADADAEEEEEERCSARSDQKGCNSTGRNGSLKPSGAEISTDGRWEEREKAIPLKKRKGSLEWGGGSGTAAAAAHDHKKQKKAKKTKITKLRPTKKKAQDYNDDDDEEEEGEGKRGGGASGTTEAAGEAVSSVQGNKKLGSRRGNNGGLMEGSRCSRINGRGWRCCQQTLVGYSLCEHHLGKGRLRSMNSFPGRVSAAASRPAAVHDNAAGSIIISDKSEAQTTAAASSKSATKKKIGMVKARSISSLLGLSTTAILSTNTATTAAAAAAASASSTASSAPATATASSS